MNAITTPPSNPRDEITYLRLKSNIADDICWHNSGGERNANVIINNLERLTHYEFDVILTKEMLESSNYIVDKQILLELLQKLRRWIAQKQPALTYKDPLTPDAYLAEKQAIADSIQTTVLDMYRYITGTSVNIELGQKPCPCEPESSKIGRFVRYSEFDIYAKSAESNVEQA